MCIVWGAAACWATMTACVSIDLLAIDWDGDGVPDVTDAFPVDPTEDTDTGNANDNSSDESPPPDANPPSSDGGGSGRRKI